MKQFNGAYKVPDPHWVRVGTTAETLSFWKEPVLSSGTHIGWYDDDHYECYLVQR